MSEDLKLNPSSLTIAIGEVLDLIAAEIRFRQAGGSSSDVTFLHDIGETLKCAVDAASERQEEVDRQRENDMALIEAQGGLANRTRMSVLLSLLISERGLMVLSDEGIALVAGAMLPPLEVVSCRAE